MAKLDEQTIEQAISMRLAGVKVSEIAQKLNVPKTALKNVFHRREIKLDKTQLFKNTSGKGISSKQKQEILDLRQQGLKLREIATKTGIKSTTIVNIVFKSGTKLTKDQKSKNHILLPEELIKEILDLRTQGLRIKDISSKLGLKVSTIDNVCLNIGKVKLNKDQLVLNSFSGSKYTWEDVSIACKEGKLIPPPLSGPIDDLHKEYLFGCKCGNKKAFLGISVRDIIYQKVSSCGCNNSFAEEELRHFVESLGVVVIPRDRKTITGDKGYGLELDIYIPEKKLAIEFAGLYWHSDEFKSDDYHETKFRLCKAKDIRLVTIYEDEWKLQKDIVKAYLMAILGAQTTKPLGARKTQVSKIRWNEAKGFLEKHHIQGAGNKGVCYGLTYNDNLVAVATFCKRKGSFEMSRYCVGGQGVFGGMAKLIEKFKNDHGPTKITTFSDNRWSIGDIYIKNGFRNDGQVKRSYDYVRRSGSLTREYKGQFRKEKIKDLYPDIYHISKKEKQMMEEAGWARIWDCGKVRWVLDPTPSSF